MKYIKRKIRKLGKRMLANVIPDSFKMRYLAALPGFNTWQNMYCDSVPFFSDRLEMYEYINKQVLENGAINFLEFGVFRGESLNAWLELNSNPESKFYGFDTFSGLPENWETFRGEVGKNVFDVNGQVPDVSDSRASFVSGLFQDTLNGFLANYQDKETLVIHNDSDLYSSTLYVLTRCNDIIKPGTIIIFDEFASILDEFRAYNDYCSAYYRKYELLAATDDYCGHVVVRML